MMWLYHTLMSPNNADGMANSVDPDQTAPKEQSDLGCTVCPGLSVRKFRIITVSGLAVMGKCYIFTSTSFPYTVMILSFHYLEVRIENSITRVTVRHHEACPVMPNSYPRVTEFSICNKQPLWILFFSIFFH